MWRGVIGRRAVVAAVGAVLAALVLAPAATAAYPGRDGLIAFTRVKYNEWGRLYVVRPDGSGLRQIRLGGRPPSTPTWSPDGRRIAFVSWAPDGPNHLFVKRLGGGVRRLTHGRDEWRDPTWSPDGRSLAAIRIKVGKDGMSRWTIVVMRADGSRKHVVQGPREMGYDEPAWSPHGRWIAYSQTDTNLDGADPNLYVMPAGGGPARLITIFDSQTEPDWSPDGSMLAYQFGLGLGNDDIRLVRPDGTGDVALTDDLLISDSAPVWSPSGRRLAISRQVGIWTINADGTDLRQIVRPPGGGAPYYDGEPTWQPRP
jgi:Tol biopolymer transport system component